LTAGQWEYLHFGRAKNESPKRARAAQRRREKKQMLLILQSVLKVLGSGGRKWGELRAGRRSNSIIQPFII
jgi:hypothetical protein